MASNLPEWAQLLNSLAVGVVCGGMVYGLYRLDNWRKQRKAKRG